MIFEILIYSFFVRENNLVFLVFVKVLGRPKNKNNGLSEPWPCPLDQKNVKMKTFRVLGKRNLKDIIPK